MGVVTGAPTHFLFIWMYTSFYIYLFFTVRWRTAGLQDSILHTGVWKSTPFAQALALQHSSRKCYVAPDLVLFILDFPPVSFSGGVFFSQTPVGPADLHSAKRGAVETGCSELYGVMHYYTIYYYPNVLHPPSTAPPCNEYPVASFRMLMFVSFVLSDVETRNWISKFRM